MQITAFHCYRDGDYRPYCTLHGCGLFIPARRQAVKFYHRSNTYLSRQSGVAVPSSNRLWRSFEGLWNSYTEMNFVLWFSMELYKKKKVAKVLVDDASLTTDNMKKKRKRHITKSTWYCGLSVRFWKQGQKIGQKVRECGASLPLVFKLFPLLFQISYLI